jgi:hypothetical protein
MFAGLLQDLKARDDASLHLIQGHQPPELDFGSAFVARNDPRVRFKEAQVGLLLSFIVVGLCVGIRGGRRRRPGLFLRGCHT